jgi:hypothetical protein
MYVQVRKTMKLKLFAFCVLGLIAQPAFAQNFEIRTYAGVTNWGVHDIQGDGLIDFWPSTTSANIIGSTGSPELQAFHEFRPEGGVLTRSVMKLRMGDSATYETTANQWVEGHSFGPFSALVDAYSSHATVTESSGLQPENVQWSSRTSWERKVFSVSQGQWVNDLPPVVVVRGGNASNFFEWNGFMVTAPYYTGVYMWTVKTRTSVAVVPEPATMLALASGVALLVRRKRG